MSHIAGRAICPAVHLAVAHDAAANASTDLDHQEVFNIALQTPLLAQRHQVHIVVDEHRSSEFLAQIVLDGKAVPLGHQRRVNQLPADKIHRARHTNTNANDLFARISALLEQLSHQHPNTRQHNAGAAAHIRGFTVVRQHLQVRQHQCQIQTGGAQIGAKDDAQAAVQLDGFGSAPTRRTLQASLFQQARIQQ